MYKRQPIDAYADQIQKLKSTSAKIHGASFNGSTYSCTADAEGSPKLLYFGIPYSSGWSAYVDDNPVEIKHSNVAFMGVELDGGRHEVEPVSYTHLDVYKRQVYLCGKFFSSSRIEGQRRSEV